MVRLSSLGCVPYALVINYDLPQSAVDYIHRVGRTGRMGKRGTALTYYSDADLPHLRNIVNVLKASDQPVPEHLRNLPLLKTFALLLSHWHE